MREDLKKDSVNYLYFSQTYFETFGYRIMSIALIELKYSKDTALKDYLTIIERYISLSPEE